LIGRQNRRVAAFTALAGAVGVLAAFSTGALDLLTGRISELSSPGSSGWQRLIAPLLQLQDVYSDPAYVLTGVGAGNSVETDVSLWPVAKVMVEYGALAGLLFMIFMAACMGRSLNKPLAFALFVAFNFTGGFLLTPVTVIQIMLLVPLFAPLRGPEPAARSASTRAQGRAARPSFASARSRAPMRPIHGAGAPASLAGQDRPVAEEWR
jgi:hypothetical protein